MTSPLPTADEHATTTAAPGGAVVGRHRPRLAVDVDAANNSSHQHFVGGKTPRGMRGHSDLRSPGMKSTPMASMGHSAMDAMEFERDDDHDDDDDDGGATDSTTATDDDYDEGDGADVPAGGAPAAANGVDDDDDDPSSSSPSSPLADFITQTDRHGNASTPRSASGGAMVDPTAGRRHHRGQVRARREEGGGRGDVDMADADGGPAAASSSSVVSDDACEQLIDGIRRMCCCLLPGDGGAPPPSSSLGGGGARVGVAVDPPPDRKLDADDDAAHAARAPRAAADASYPPDHPVGYSTRGHDAPPLMEEDSALRNNPNRIRLLPSPISADAGKKCLVLDLDETLVHSSFRAVPGADFVIPVQIEDVVHFVYVAKRPGVDDFLLEMSRHYEIVVYTASLNKYADVLLDLLDPHRVVRTRLFRESCVYYEGNYVKDLCLLNRDLGRTIIIDNSPASYMFHPENAIDCSSFIDDPADRELDAIGKFLVGVKDVEDVRGTVNLWRHWPNVDLTKNHRRI